MTPADICFKVTGKPVGPYIDNGFYAITREQARKLCGGKEPRAGYEKTMKLDADGKPQPSTYVGQHDYIIAETKVSCHMGLSNGYHWSIRAG